MDAHFGGLAVIKDNLVAAFLSSKT